MKFFFRIILINIFLSIVNASLSVSKVVVRVPRPKDIGLIFDVSLTNNVKDRRELLEFNIHPANDCSLDLGPQRVMNDASRIVGGTFGSIEAGATETVSLIWPTLSLYNRIGCCTVIITSTNLKNEPSYLKETLTFDTRFDALDPQSTGIRKSKNYKDCNNFDLDYLNDCQPVNCEERYFGLRNFFDECKKQCEPVPRCEGSMHYDPFANECVDSQYTVSESDIRDIKHGLFNEFEEWIKEISRPTSNKMSYKYKKYMKRESIVDENNENDEHKYPKQPFEPDIQTLQTAWLKGTIDGLMLVFATIGIYVIICFVIFLVVSFLSSRQGYRDTVSMSPSVSEKGIPIRTRSSLLSRR